ncbi:hypothetical protein EBE87_27000 [Pseudoroseomonas wenyumeiae]|uniref:Uncharacterized protein n=1 Tax=Teichococcus wenyumeiae TaxID=2478470 RepID=A0A3A9J7A3_9PROT|nr:hypothetical protein D6Z83_24505 [Pseudoroseomonas wenyumeiae]RMI15167.1 hypothetical protein EBE87_27000 [Pseudoroseomonas wenyumeiae]
MPRTTGPSGAKAAIRCVYLRAFATGPDLRAGLSRWIRYYHAQPPHSALARQTPDEAHGAAGLTRIRALSELVSSSDRRQVLDQLVQRDRIVAHPHAGRVVDRVRYSGAHATEAEFTDALRLHGRGDRVHLVKEDDFLVRYVGVDRHFVAR